jgi:CheY-like chemotaxis protein
MPSRDLQRSAPDCVRSIRGLRVLLVEDSWIVASSLQAMLEMTGVLVIGPVTDLAEAVAAASAGGFDVAVMDLDLRGERSDALIGELVRRGYPVIVVSGYEIGEDTADKVEAILPKPFRAEHLLRTLRHIAGKQRDADAGCSLAV